MLQVPNLTLSGAQHLVSCSVLVMNRIIMDKHINHDKHHDESKTRTYRLSKLPDDGDPWAPNNLLTPEQKKNTI